MSAKIVLVALCALLAVSAVRATENCDDCDFTAPDMEPENQPDVLALEQEDDDLEDQIKRVKQELKEYQTCAEQVEAYKKELIDLQRRQLGVTNEERAARLADKMDAESKAISRIREMSSVLSAHLSSLDDASREIKEKMDLTETAVNSKKKQLEEMAAQKLEEAQKAAEAAGAKAGEKTTTEVHDVTHSLSKELQILHDGMTAQMVASQKRQKQLIQDVPGLEDKKIFSRSEWVPIGSDGEPLTVANLGEGEEQMHFKGNKRAKALKELKKLKKQLKH